jgi:hypothetical protein
LNESHPDGPEPRGGPTPKPVPRDPPDQQAAPGEDPWDAVGVPERWAEDDGPEPGNPGAVGSEEGLPDPGIPDTDEAGTGRRGVPNSGSPRPEHPVPDESSA